MKIGFLGSGQIAPRLGYGLIQLGHTVKFGTRCQAKSKSCNGLANMVEKTNKHQQEALSVGGIT